MLPLPLKLEKFLRRTRYYKMFRNQAAEADAQACRPFLRPGDLAIDVGANFGSYTKLFSECVGPGGSVHAVEPVPETFDYLHYNVRHFGLNNVFLYQVAASDYSGIAHMTMPLWHGGRRNIYEAHLDEQGNIPVRVMRLDDLFAGMKPALIKIDVEGNELQLIQGARQLLTTHHPPLLVEVSSPETTPLLAELGYTICNEGTGPNRFFLHPES